MRGLQIMSKLSQIVSPLLDLCSAVARRGIFISRARFFFPLSLAPAQGTDPSKC